MASEPAECTPRYNLEDIMLEGALKDCGEDIFWPSSVRLTLVGRGEELGMYLEEKKEDRKRKWGEEYGKVTREMEEREEKERRPAKKMIGVNDMGGGGGAGGGGGGGGGGSSSSSHLSPGWHVNDLELDLAGELSMNEALLSLPSLTMFKQEAPSPPGCAGAGAGAAPTTPRRAWLQQRRQQNERQFQMGEEMAAESGEETRQQSPGHPSGMTVNQQGGGQEMPCSQQMHTMSANPYRPSEADNKGKGLLMCSPTGSLDGFLQSPLAAQRPTVTSTDMSFRDDLRFQYVLAAATSIATKTNEESLTYLNQGQPYEIKLKKLGDLSHYKGKILKSVIKICFHERRLQYMEREQMAQWHSERPGERIVEVDIPLSYGLIRVHQPSERHSLNCVEILWDPTKDAGVYIKVNCISTEFTAKKHGGEKGVPFRVQVETFLPTHEADHRLHAAACQIKVFKLKGADRKHKQDREKVMRRPRADLEKFQPSCESTVLSTLPNDAVLPPSLIGTSPSSSPELCVSAASKPGNTLVNQPPQQLAVLPASQVKQLYCQEAADVKVTSSPHHSPGAILPDTACAEPLVGGLSAEATHADTQCWLAGQRLPHHAATFADFCGADLLRLSREDLIQICGLADGIRLFNALHAKRIEPRLTVFVCAAAGAAAGGVYSAVYLHSCTAAELLGKLRQLLPNPTDGGCDSVLVSGPGGARVFLTDELVRHLPDNSTYRLQRHESMLLLTPTQH